MKNTYFNFLILFFIVQLSTLAEANAQARLDGKLNSPMEFLTFTPCLGNASFCADAILAIGNIEHDSATKLKAISPREGRSIYFHSRGGDLVGGLALGSAIREIRLNSIVGGDYSESISTTKDRPIVSDSVCASACSFAFLGGIKREIINEKAFLVHQFYSKLRAVPEGDAQKTVALLNLYLDHMGILREALDQMLLTEPENGTYFTLRQLWDLGIYNDSVTIGLPPDLQPKQKLLNNSWDLAFKDDEQPILTLKRPTFFKNGLVATTVQRKGDDYQIYFGVQWSSTTDKQRREGAFGELTNYKPRVRGGGNSPYAFTPISFCSDSSDPTQLDYCSVEALSKSTLAREWSQHGPLIWNIAFYLSKEELDLLLNSRPNTLKLDCGISNSLREFDFCDKIELGKDFWQKVKLL